MSYQSPIEVFQTQMQSQIAGEIYKAVMEVGVNVDKDELLKALQYDRDQYQKGYKDRDDQIVRCKDCIYWQDNNDGYPHIGCKWRNDETPDPDDFCSAGERKEGR